MYTNIDNLTYSSVEFLPIMKKQFEKDLPVILTVTGNSMIPFLAHKRDSVILTKYNGIPKTGDVLLYVRGSGKCVLHRVIRITDSGIYFIGDGQRDIEGPVKNECVLAECHHVIRKGKQTSETSFVWRFFKFVWLRIIPLRIPIIRFISKFK